MTKTTFTTVDGREWRITPVSFDLISRSIASIRQKMLDDGAILTKPTYEVETVGGAKEKYEADDKAVEQRNDPELTAAWQKYKADIALFNARQAKRSTEIFVFEGLVPNIQEQYQDSAWVARHDRWGIGIPTDPDARLEHFVGLEVLKTAEDTLRFIEAITVLSGQGRIDEGEVSRLMELFRRHLSQKPGSEAPPA